MYITQSSKCTDINECRYMQFCTRRGEVDSCQLAPCKDTLYQHIMRANYQAGIWKRCLDANIDVPNPNDHGWTVDIEEGSIAVKWMTGKPAPQSVMDLLRCDAVGKVPPLHVLVFRMGLNAHR